MRGAPLAREVRPIQIAIVGLLVKVFFVMKASSSLSSAKEATRTTLLSAVCQYMFETLVVLIAK